MELITDKVEHFQKFYVWALTRADDRVKDWLFMQSYTPTLAITALYLFAVWVGPKIMKDREPFKFKWTLFFYNFGLIVMNFHICSQLLWYSTKLNYSYSCQPVNYTREHGEMKIASALWWFYFSKCVEMLDTIFFIMRKKDNQVSFLHVYHHASMFPIWWVGIKWVAGGQSFFGAMINSFIHVLMYTYYGVSALGPEYQKYLWWKRYLTKLQLIQFVTGIVHAVQSLTNGCDFPEALHWALIIYAFTILLLFLNFYFHTYLKSRSAKTKGGDSKAQVSNGKVANGTTRGHKRNGSVVTANGVIEAKKDK
ncbi:very long chain fatty acid elongase 4-like isoform X2 [Haliotis cracherodii]|uniref:very long chain fatty acid elongase 4-like isoform X2 n=1 Tax=Haliotis cracherodii TaxID=6455 RepID=UPI0039ECB961